MIRRYASKVYFCYNKRLFLAMGCKALIWHWLVNFLQVNSIGIIPGIALLNHDVLFNLMLDCNESDTLRHLCCVSSWVQRALFWIRQTRRQYRCMIMPVCSPAHTWTMFVGYLIHINWYIIESTLNLLGSTFPVLFVSNNFLFHIFLVETRY